MFHVQVLALLLLDKSVKFSKCATGPVDGIDLLPQLGHQAVVGSLFGINPVQWILLGRRVGRLLLERLHTQFVGVLDDLHFGPFKLQRGFVLFLDVILELLAVGGNPDLAHVWTKHLAQHLLILIFKR